MYRFPRNERKLVWHLCRHKSSDKKTSQHLVDLRQAIVLIATHTKSEMNLGYELIRE